MRLRSMNLEMINFFAYAYGHYVIIGSVAATLYHLTKRLAVQWTRRKILLDE